MDLPETLAFLRAKQKSQHLQPGRVKFVHSGRLALDWPDARNQAECGGHYERMARPGLEPGTPRSCSLRLGALDRRNPWKPSGSLRARPSGQPLGVGDGLRAVQGMAGRSSPQLDVRSRIHATTSSWLASLAATRSTRPASASTFGGPHPVLWRRGSAQSGGTPCACWRPAAGGSWRGAGAGPPPGRPASVGLDAAERGERHVQRGLGERESRERCDRD